MITKETSQKVLGAGELYFDEFDVSGNTTGEQYLGDTPGFTVSLATTKVEDYSSDGPIAEKDIDIVTKVVRSGKITCKNISDDNLARFVIGDVSSITQVATPIVAEPINDVTPGRYYQLGVTTANPAGARNVSAVIVKDDTTPTPITFVLGIDYELDATLARLRVLVGGGILAADNLRVDYTPAINTRSRVTSNASGAKFGRLRYIATNTTGPNRDLVAPYVQLAPSGDLPWKSRDNVMQMEFDCEFQARGTQAAVYIDGRPA